MEKQIKEILNEINIKENFKKDGDYYVVTLNSYEEFVKSYNNLEKSLKVFKNSLSSFMTEDESYIQYETKDGIVIVLIGLFNKDQYTINISIDKDN